MSVAFTTDTYSHIIEGMQEDAMALLDEVLPPGKDGVSQKLTPNPDFQQLVATDLASKASVAQG